MTDEPEPGLELTSSLVPLFVITNGRSLPPEHAYERTTLVAASQDASDAEARTLSPEARQVLELVTGGFLSVAEVAAHTHLPLGIVRILLAQLEERGLIAARKPIPRAEHVDRDVLNAVLDGLRARFGA
ncbi:MULTISPECIES: DUF742 domain-containing protein [Streptomyces]|uniref:DUF742 domain-containing protein n=1 Tax=Streptomyces thermoviolaceus subsp. thermoviolaceus TaxID=66860 RepID=A0ABX0YP24_STRTL|nr:MULTISPECIES: DUF742 domain-containing protein [Streptomyces]NJP14307.1 DUF742 domain-containing protein [Streptomyces thermoviolaceus subsp. thermoviolaceus]RSR96637.1 DUF742 domain-containing protein [Streptomyces sp. WAC00469]GGV79212.1 hypothetical protein GCM10010499_40170 [Streptomyces thermoviolaceus subsp. apingens]GHA92605.1 hypothetical protein GCM10010512_25290 [Streptomyces thermoviolaceus subsp. thermoviolaceus]